MPDFKYPDPWTIDITVGSEHSDAFGHVNNAVYITWFERCTWAHAEAVGLPLAQFVALRRAMAVRHTEVDYLRAAFPGDRLTVACWIIEANKLRVTRSYQIFRQADDALVATATVQFVCINMDTGIPCRMPPEFVAGFTVHPGLQAG